MRRLNEIFGGHLEDTQAQPSPRPGPSSASQLPAAQSPSLQTDPASFAPEPLRDKAFAPAPGEQPSFAPDDPLGFDSGYPHDPPAGDYSAAAQNPGTPGGQQPSARTAPDLSHAPDPAQHPRARRFSRGTGRFLPVWLSAETLKQSVRIGLPLGAILLTVGAGFWVWHTGRLDVARFQAGAQAGESVAAVGLTLESISIARAPQYTTTEELRTALSANQGAPILSIDPHHLRQNLLALPWVRSATVQRQLPNRLLIDISEKQPISLWVNGGRTSVIDSTGARITDVDPSRFDGLPVVVGPGADKQAVPLLALLNLHPRILGQVQSALLVQNRRWTLRLNNGISVHLPEETPDLAIRRLANLDKSDSLLNRDIVEIDLRLPDRMVVRTKRSVQSDGSEGSGGTSSGNVAEPI